jgi:drug/metabolite transporter (DMT)-like permease
LKNLLIAILSLFLFRKDNPLSKDFNLIRNDKKLQIQISFSVIFSSLGSILFYNALKILPISIVSLTQNSIYTILVITLSIIYLKEKIGRNGVYYILICLLGLTLIITKGSLTHAEIPFKGLIILLSGAFFTATNAVIDASSLKKISAVTSATIKSTSLILLSLTMISQNQIQELSIELISLFTYQIVFFLLFTSTSAFLIKYLHGRSVQELNSSKTAIFTLLTPIISTFMAMIVFQEWYNIYQYLGMVIVLLSVYKLR